MKTMKPKTHSWMLLALVGLALSASVGFGVPVLTISTFDDASPTTNNMWDWYGGAVFAWDATQNHTGNGGGSLHITHAAAAGDTIMIPETFLPGSGIWWGGPSPVDCTTYSNVTVWFKWDTNYSTMPISTFNTEGNGGMGISVNNASTWDAYRINVQVPNAASNGWVHLNFPLNPAIPGIAQFVGIDYADWKPAPWSGDVGFWVDDVIVDPGITCECILPPTIKSVTKAISGLNVFNGSQGNSFFDRQSVYCLTNAGTSWYGAATPGNPVTYSFTIKSMPAPASVTAGCEAWLFLSPNPAAVANSPDWNETNMVIAFVQQDANGNATLHFQYKINEPSQQGMYSGATNVVEGGVTNNYGNAPGSWNGVTTPWLENGNLGSVTNPATAVGTWTIKFTSDTNVTLISPVGNTSSFAIPPYNVGNLNPGAGGMRIYLGGQANNVVAINQPVVYSSFVLAGTPTAISDNFLADSILDTNTWSRSAATLPAGVLVLPASAVDWVSWTVLAGGFSLECGNQLTNLGVWTSPTMYPKVQMVNVFAQCVDSTEVPAGPVAFFNCIRRVATQLQVLLPGETAAPGTPSGKTGTPTPISLGAGGLVNVTVNACDSSWHVVNGVFDSIHLATSDGASIDPFDTSMVYGTVTFAPLQFQTIGPQTITAWDVTYPAISPATSSPVTVVP